MYIMAFDVSKGKSYIVLYKNQDLIYEGEITHNPTAFNELFPFLKRNEVELVFEATAVYSKPLEYLFETNGFDYYCLNPLEASFQTATLRQMETDQADAHRLVFANLKYIVLQRKVHNVAIQLFPFNYSDLDNAFFKRKLTPVNVNMCV